MNLTLSLAEALRDLRYLLSRGYNRESAVKFVADKHRLTPRERHVLKRAVYDKAEADRIGKKVIKIESIRGKIVSIDGYNLLITVESMLANKLLIHCDDHVTRDISAVFGKHKISARTTQALQMILRKLAEYGPSEVHFSYDKQVSRSGELASLTRRLITEFKLRGTAKTTPRTDIATLGAGEVIVSSDSLIIQKAKAVLDLAGELTEQAPYDNLIQLPL